MPERQTNWGMLLTVSGPGAEHLARALRAAIRDGVVPPGAALPPSRRLADDLSCSRWVVTQAYAQLIAEGYLVGRTGSATRVSETGPSDTARPPAPEPIPPRYDLAPGVPDLRAFPRQRWIDAARQVLSTMPHTDLGVPPVGGHPRLRAVLAEYLRRVRGAVTEDVLICSGVTDGVHRIARALKGAVAVEDPGWPRLWRAASSAGVRTVPVPVDEDGLRVDLIPSGVKAVVVTPAHHFPTGVVLSPARRASLLAWADANDGLILEDDYDAEFRYDRRPVGTMQGLAPRRVVLLGSVSKTLSPALGIGWCVIPPQWTQEVASANPTASAPPVLDQLTLAEFITTGAYDRHLRTARLTYRARRDALLTALPDAHISGAAAGLHLLLHLNQPATALVQKAATHNLKVRNLDDYRTTPGPPALVLGYGNLADNAITDAVAALRAAGYR